MESIVQRINGQEVNMGDATMTGSVTRSYQITDTYAAVDKERATSRERSLADFEGEIEIALIVMGEEENHTATLSNPLDGLDIDCTWNEKDETFRYGFGEGSDGDATLLENLLIDAEFSLMPPNDEVEESDSWIVDLADGRALFSPGGALAWDAELGPEGFQNLEPQNVISIALMNLGDVSEDIEGEAEVSWTKTISKDDRKLAVLEVEVTAELTAELGERLNALCSSAGVEPLDMAQDTSWSVEGEGELLWDLESGHFHSFEIEYDTVIELTLEWEQDGAEIEIEVELSGTTEFSAEHEEE